MEISTKHSGLEKELSPKQEEAITLLLTLGLSRSDIAKKLGIAERTLNKWLNDKSFVVKLNEAQATLREQSMGALQACMKKAVKKLDELIESPKEDVSLKAINIVINSNIKLRDEFKLEERFFKFEEFIER